MTNELYPLRFKPLFKERIWGGNRFLKDLQLTGAPEALCGEAWLISGLGGEQSIVSNGYLAGNELSELIEIFMGDLVGEKVYEEYGEQFPVLLKLLDANDWLSLQVHPGDALAEERYGENGKSELWYVMDAAPGARLVSGFSKATDSKQFAEILKDEKLVGCLNYETVAAGDLFHIPAGRVHSLGPGILLAEIQQSSDRTYRLHDWGRVDSNGRARELHLDEAMDAIEYEVISSAKTSFPNLPDRSNTMLRAPYFDVNYLNLTRKTVRDYENLDSFVILLCVSGSTELESGGERLLLGRGEAVMLPNLLDRAELLPQQEAGLLEIYIS